METHALKVMNVSAGYGASMVINNINMDVLPGETYGLIGLNGAGKTTLLKTILGLKSAYEGSLSVASYRAGTPEAKKSIAFLPERFDPAWFLNAYEFINFTLSLYGGKASRAKIDDIAERVGFNVAYLSRRAQAYSKGMRQKLGLMATFLTDCPLYILDEPMSGLDPLARAQVKDLMISAKKEGRTIFLSSHILSDLEELCDRVSVLHNGQIRFTGTPSLLLFNSNEATLEKAFLSLIK